MGRLGSDSPARLRRTAFATSFNASSCPTTRSRRRSSICTSLATSPSSIFETGMPVHFETTRATSSSSTSSFSMRPAFCISSSFAFAAASCFSSVTSLP